MEDLETFQSTLGVVADRWKGAGLLLHGFPLLARGEPLAIREIAEATGVDEHRIDGQLKAARCARDSAGRLVDLYGMSLVPTLHRLVINDRTLFSCCALWAHVIPLLVRERVCVQSVDPIQRNLVHLTLTPDGIESVEPQASVASLPVATREAIQTDVGEAFCRHANHFTSPASAAHYATANPSCHAVALPVISEAAVLLHQAILTAASPDPKPL